MSSEQNTKQGASPPASTKPPLKIGPVTKGGFKASKGWMERQFPDGQPIKVKE